MITAILQKCGRGLLYIITLPVLLLALSVYAVIGVIEFIFVGTKAIIYFFTGRNLFGDFPEDIKAREILEGKVITNINIVKEDEPNAGENNTITTPPPYITNPDNNETEDNGVTIVTSEDEDKHNV